MTREEMYAALKTSEDLEQMLTDLLAAKRAYDETVNNILRRTYDDDK